MFTYLASLCLQATFDVRECVTCRPGSRLLYRLLYGRTCSNSELPKEKVPARTPGYFEPNANVALPLGQWHILCFCVG